MENKLHLCGIDEAGRGPLAGPVYAAAVILKDDFPLNLLNDSKKLSAAKREKARSIICSEAYCFGIGWASHSEIDSINILQASLLAMKRAFEDLLKRADENNKSLLGEKINAIVDGIYVPDINIPCTAMIKADAKVCEVMAASILAKTERDEYMEKMALLYPQYGYEKHKGYPTASHREAVLKFGPSPIQRLSFKVK
ncbi:MAG: ribonuclease HII [Treponema sp.]|nr:ribonuclease HII [Treponema sp.]MCL2251895.1 ribonuclease HII [Treponema sp.]